ncbi:hypothetical protein EI94DRAFT_1786482, partial [Lactarius quietus]
MTLSIIALSALLEMEPIAVPTCAVQLFKGLPRAIAATARVFLRLPSTAPQILLSNHNYLPQLPGVLDGLTVTAARNHDDHDVMSTVMTATTEQHNHDDDLHRTAAMSASTQDSKLKGAQRVFGTTDNFNTQYTEHLHIDLVKDAYAATNHKDEGEQMTTWNDCKERVHHHDQYVTSRMTGETPRRVDLVPPTLSPRHILTMAKHPSKYAVPLNRLQDTYGAPLFKVALRRFISATNNPNQSHQQLEDSLWVLRLPFTCLPIWHVIKFQQFDPVTGKHSTADAIHARPTRNGKHNQPIPGRFDTALINDGTGKGHGVKGYHVGCIRAIFSIPPKFHASLFNPSVAVPLHLAYVQWYSLLTVRDPNHGMFKIHPQKDSDANWTC